MDLSIRLVTPGMQFDRGVDAYERGQGINDHCMNDGAPAIKDWQEGWLWAQRAAGQQRGEVSPP